MKTIEQYEAEIESKSNRIQQQLDVFQDNVGQIASVINKDSTYVMTILQTKYKRTMFDYNNTTRRSPEILQGYVDSLDKIQAVLNEVMTAVETLEGADDETLDASLIVNDIMEGVAETVSDISEGAEEITESVTGQKIPGWVVLGGLAAVAYWLMK